MREKGWQSVPYVVASPLAETTVAGYQHYGAISSESEWPRVQGHECSDFAGQDTANTSI
jgi:hypothetical protein